MKVAKINHYRCDDFSATTYVWVPDDTTQEQFEDAVFKAQDVYLAFCREFAARIKVGDPGWVVDYRNYPNKQATLAEIDEEFAAKKAVYNEWHEQEKKAYKTFGEYLRAEGYIPLWDHEPELLIEELDWSHYHGIHIGYEDTLDDDNIKKDLPGPLKQKTSRF